MKGVGSLIADLIEPHRLKNRFGTQTRAVSNTKEAGFFIQKIVCNK